MHFNFLKVENENTFHFQCKLYLVGMPINSWLPVQPHGCTTCCRDLAIHLNSQLKLSVPQLEQSFHFHSALDRSLSAQCHVRRLSALAREPHGHSLDCRCFHWMFSHRWLPSPYPSCPSPMAGALQKPRCSTWSHRIRRLRLLWRRRFARTHAFAKNRKWQKQVLT